MTCEKANIKLYVMLSLMPFFISLYPLRKIQKLRKGLLLNLLVSIGCIGWYAIFPAQYVILASYITSGFVLTLFIRHWSIKWNQNLEQVNLK